METNIIYPRVPCTSQQPMVQNQMGQHLPLLYGPTTLAAPQAQQPQVYYMAQQSTPTQQLAICILGAAPAPYPYQATSPPSVLNLFGSLKSPLDDIRKECGHRMCSKFNKIMACYGYNSGTISPVMSSQMSRSIVFDACFILSLIHKWSQTHNIIYQT